MPSTIQLDRLLPASTREVFAVLSSREFAEQRIGREPAMNARLEHFESGPESFRMEVRGDLPTSWLPSGVGAAAGIHRVESWRPVGNAYVGDLLLQAEGLPVRTEGAWRLSALPDNAGFSLLQVEASVTVSMPIVGPIVERLVAERISGELNDELSLLAEALESS